jgi:hypothetical protein
LIHTFTEDNITAFTSLDVPTLVVNISEGDDASVDIFTQAATSLMDENAFVFGMISSVSVREGNESPKPPFVVLHSRLDELPQTHLGSFHAGEIASWAASAASAPLIGRFDLNTLLKYTEEASYLFPGFLPRN